MTIVKGTFMPAGSSRGKPILLLCALMALLTVSNARARTMSAGGWDISFALLGGFIDQGYGLDSKVSMPGYMANERHTAVMTLYYPDLKTDNLTDNPLLHGALYTHFTLDARNAGLHISSRLIMEHRGTSSGTYAMNAIAVLPTFFAAIDTTVSVGGQTFGIGVGGGNYDAHKLYEGLTIYNIDVQGYHLHLQWKHLRLSLDHIADLGMGIGLNIDDEADYAVSLENVSLIDRLKLDASAGYVEYLGASNDEVNGLPENGMNLSAALQWNESARLYGQLGIRNVDDDAFGGMERCADLIGCAYTGAPLKHLDLDVTGEYRYYGRYFNEGRSQNPTCFLYRGYEGYGACSSWNTIGSQLYPIHLFERPFSQWAVYTDYEGRDVETFIVRADASYELPAHLAFVCNLDFNYLEVSNEDPFLYPFYNVGFGWTPVRGTSIAVTHTNRAMNLDKQYPTLYLTEEGAFMVTLQILLTF